MICHDNDACFEIALHAALWLAITEKPTRRSVSVETLSYCCTNNANILHVSLRSTFSNCHALFSYLHSFVHASLQ